MWKLVIEDDEGKRTVVPLTRDDYTIGRQEGNTIRLTERNVSRQHGRVRRSRNGSSKDAFALEDLRSYNGVFINGLRVAHTQDLQHGDLIQIGDYRIVLQDDAASAIETAIPITTTEPDAKQTIPMAAGYRSQALTERPNRMVMLVGPTPGVEYPLDRERMTIGRAEDASISVNHNSVSRLHCEVHALGDGRFEIVDKGSSNGVRVNAVELKRSIIEAGDVIELGDVRFKFVGANQVFVAGPNESQQLTAISDRDAELADPRKKGGIGGYVLPILAAGVVGAGIILAVVFMLKSRVSAETDGTAPTDADQTVVQDAKRQCSINDCEKAKDAVAALPDTSPWRRSQDVRDIFRTWAESVLRKAEGERDPGAKKSLLNRVIAEPNVDADTKARANAELNKVIEIPGQAPTELPVAIPRDAGASPTALVTAPAPTPRERPTAPTSHTTVTNATTNAPSPSPTPKTSANSSNYDNARAAGLRGDHAVVRNLLETRVRNGHATVEEAWLVKEACKAQKDRGCVDDVKAKYPAVP